MDDQLRLMCVMAHPDDETLGTGGILAKYAAEGVETYLVTATRGERGWFGDPDDNPGLDELGRLRTAELHAAAATLGLNEVSFLDYIDGDLDQADPDEAIRKIVTHIRRVRPQVVVTFDPGGAYGHPDHIAICQFTTAALVAAADSSYHDLQNLPPHRVLKLYYMMATKEEAAIYEEAFGDLVMVIDGVERRVAAWESWAITTRVDTSEYWEQVWDAVFCHKTQLPGYDALKQLPVERQQELWAANSFYRALSLVNGGRKPETDLFEGVREYQKRESSK
jgi:LmbE family N-acetylglucosaminyl deacetylase